MAAEVREQIMALLEKEPQTPSILRQLEFLERDLARLEAPPAPAQGNYLMSEEKSNYYSLEKSSSNYLSSTVALFQYYIKYYILIILFVVFVVSLCLAPPAPAPGNLGVISIAYFPYLYFICF